MENELQKEIKSFSVLQKALLIFLYGLIILMVIFSVMAIKNLSEGGFDKCIQKKCEAGGEEHCQKFREINNCCLGAGGQMAASENGYTCVFR